MSGIKNKVLGYLDSLKPKRRHPIWEVVEEDAELHIQFCRIYMEQSCSVFGSESDQPITLTGLHTVIMCLSAIKLDDWMQKERGMGLADYCQEKAKKHSNILEALEGMSHV